MSVWAYVFITTDQPYRAVQAIREIPGIVQAMVLANAGVVGAVVIGEEATLMKSVIHQISEIPEVSRANSMAVHWVSRDSLQYSPAVRDSSPL